MKNLQNNGFAQIRFHGSTGNFDIVNIYKGTLKLSL